MAQSDGLPLVYAFSTFFFTKLRSCGCKSIRHWTHKVDIFAHDILLFPLHMANSHWSLAVVDFAQINPGRCMEK